MAKSENKKTNLLPFILVGVGLIIIIGIAVYLQSLKDIDQIARRYFYSPQSKLINLHRS